MHKSKQTRCKGSAEMLERIVYSASRTFSADFRLTKILTANTANGAGLGSILHCRALLNEQESSAKLTNQRVSYAFASSPFSFHARHILSFEVSAICVRQCLLTLNALHRLTITLNNGSVLGASTERSTLHALYRAYSKHACVPIEGRKIYFQVSTLCCN